MVVTAFTMLASVVAYVYTIGGGRGGPGTSTSVTELYIFNALIHSSLPGIAAAVLVMLLGISSLLIVPFFSSRRQTDGEGR